MIVGPVVLRKEVHPRKVVRLAEKQPMGSEIRRMFHPIVGARSTPRSAPCSTRLFGACSTRLSRLLQNMSGTKSHSGGGQSYHTGPHDHRSGESR